MLSRADLDASVRMWAWLRPLLVLLFPEEVTIPPWGEPGTVSSPLRRIDAMGRASAGPPSWPLPDQGGLEPRRLWVRQG